MNTLIITAIVACTVIIIVAICKWWEYKNPYVDVETNRTHVYGSESDKMPYKAKIEYKRTWKNGKVTYITKEVSS